MSLTWICLKQLQNNTISNHPSTVLVIFPRTRQTLTKHTSSSFFFFLLSLRMLFLVHLRSTKVFHEFCFANNFCFSHQNDSWPARALGVIFGWLSVSHQPTMTGESRGPTRGQMWTTDGDDAWRMKGKMLGDVRYTYIYLAAHAAQLGGGGPPGEIEWLRTKNNISPPPAAKWESKWQMRIVTRNSFVLRRCGPDRRRYLLRAAKTSNIIR